MSCSPRSHLQSWRVYRPYRHKLEHAEKLSEQAANYLQEIGSVERELKTANKRISALEREGEYLERQDLDRQAALDVKNSLHAQANNKTAESYQAEIHKLQQAFEVVRNLVEHDGLGHCQTVQEASSRLSAIKKRLDCFEKLKEVLHAMAESPSDDHIAAVYFARACETNSIPYADLDIDRCRAALLFQSRFRDG